VTFAGESSSPFRPRLYGRRRGRPIRPNRRALLRDQLPAVSVDLQQEYSGGELRRLFEADVADVWLEVGFGSGEHLLGQARRHPHVGFVGCEPYINGVAALLAQASDAELTRIRIVADDARPLLQTLPEAGLGRAYVLFADPWPKRRHQTRRFVQAETVTRLAHVLRPGGDLIFATDDAAYARWTLALATDHPAFRWLARRPADWRQPPAGWVTTRYQAKAEAKGAPCFYLEFRRISRV
jgi:tRNA (guanine-N7-)-methyltransferase